MIDITSEKSIIESLILKVLGKEWFDITLGDDPVLTVKAEDYKCDVWFFKDSSCDYPVIFIDESNNKHIRAEDWKIENFNREKIFKNFQYYINYYVNLLRPFYYIKCVEVVEKIVNLYGVNNICIVYTFNKHRITKGGINND